MSNTLFCFRVHTYSTSREWENIILLVLSNIRRIAIKYNRTVDTIKNKCFSLIIRQLISAIWNYFIPREIVFQILEKGWKFLKFRRLEELLILIAIPLARLSKSKKTKLQTIDLFKKIKNKEFAWSGKKPRERAPLYNIRISISISHCPPT